MSSIPIDPVVSAAALSAAGKLVSVLESDVIVRSTISCCKRQEWLNEAVVSDNDMKEARFAFRSNDLERWNKISSRQHGEVETNSHPVNIQHWAIVVHFPGKKMKTYIFEAGDREGKLEATRSVAVDETIFNESQFIGSHITSPKELVNIAKELQCLGKTYHAGFITGIINNCQTFAKEFLKKINPDLLSKLHEEIPMTDYP